jgi:cation diffusion facilitator family transporter
MRLSAVACRAGGWAAAAPLKHAPRLAAAARGGSLCAAPPPSSTLAPGRRLLHACAAARHGPGHAHDDHGHAHAHAGGDAAGGSHGHSHGGARLPPPQADPALRRAATAVVNVSLLSDLSLAVLKGVAGAWTGSAALVSDAVHSAGDMLISTTVLLSHRVSSQPPDSDHPYGHGRFDAVGALAVSGLLVFSGVGIGLRAFESITQALAPGGRPEPLLTMLDETPAELLADPASAAVALGACLASMGVKEALYRWSARVGVAARSQALIANAAHHRADSLSSAVAAIGIGGAWLGVPVLDPLAALGIAAMVGKLGVDVGLGAGRELVDTRLDGPLLAEVEALARGHADIAAIRRLRARRMGPSVLVDLEICVRPDISVAAAAAVADALRRDVYAARPEVTEALVSTFPVDEAAGLGRGGGGSGGGAVSASSPRPGTAPPSASAPAPHAPPSSTSPTYAAAAAGVRATLERLPGVRAVTACDAVPASSGAVPPGAPLPVAVRARVLCDMDAPLRDALAVARRARRRLLEPPPASHVGGGGGGAAAPPAGWVVLDAAVELELNPV